MASFNVNFILVALFVMSGAVIATEEADIIKKYDCENETKMGQYCIMEIFTSIFKIGDVTDKCCGELMVLGKICHAALVKRTLQLPQFKNMEESKIVAKSIQIWNKCAVVTKSVSPSPSP
ncbi:protein DOWN-REGULATED IN DIF1 11-like [Durio zibethinus]|uniref:Protein DOWN-REGULATED IN DIF1 11-like n=1 Tax=Durio zibethinus TaxID=66656 RepID=A0A6P5YGD4_DURZI|nr:protein DOWN-REGULATED IN DIF1 11-like [Durio zibethinus]